MKDLSSTLHELIPSVDEPRKTFIEKRYSICKVSRVLTTLSVGDEKCNTENASFLLFLAQRLDELSLLDQFVLKMFKHIFCHYCHEI